MIICLALMFFAIAYYAEPIVDHWPEYAEHAKHARGFFDDLAAGDPEKVIKYTSATATIVKIGYESADVKYPVNGYYLFGGIPARNAAERAILNTSMPGQAIVVFYDPVNPTIAVMEPTWREACRKTRGVKKLTHKVRKDKKYMPGYGSGSRPMVQYLRIGGSILGLVFMGMAAKGRKEEHNI